MTEVRTRQCRDSDGPDLAALLARTGWEQRYVEGQLAAVAALRSDPDGAVLVAGADSGVLGYVSVAHTRWNALGQLHGLVVDPDARRTGVALRLVRAAEDLLREQGARGCRVDTPVDNATARAFYRAAGYTEDYTMTRYYSDDLDGVTCVRFFDDRL